MNAALRHLAIRLWATALLGSMVCMMVLPFWQSVLKVQWVAIPVVFILGICFVLLGWSMNRYGNAKIKRLINEAGAWERAGDRDTAQEIFERAVAVFDSFWLSPMGRHRIESLVTGRLARFYLSQSTLQPPGELMVFQHLMRHPEDVPVVRSWLVQVLAQPHTHSRHDLLAARISDALPDDLEVQHLLMDYYLGTRRCDFDAIQTYRRVWQIDTGIADSVLQDLARVLLQNNQLNDWALDVYLKGYESGDPYCLEGVVAACHHLRPHPGNRQVLSRAHSLCESLDADFIEKAAGRFIPLAAAEPSGRSEPLKPRPALLRIPFASPLKTVGRLSTAAAAQLLVWGSKTATSAVHVMRHNRRIPGPVRQLKPIALKPAMGLVLLLLAVGVTLLAGYRYQYQRISKPDTSAGVEVPPPEVAKPFTIQVAAYLKPEDARRYVSHLANQGLEAFSTEAVSARRKWYQVKVSRFETKHQAQLYGEKLKSQGLIDDFYVANYKQQ